MILNSAPCPRRRCVALGDVTRSTILAETPQAIRLAAGLEQSIKKLINTAPVGYKK